MTLLLLTKRVLKRCIQISFMTFYCLNAAASHAESVGQDNDLLCSPEGLARLIPQLSENGNFSIPDPANHLDQFMAAQQGLSNVVELILARESARRSPSEVGRNPNKPLIFSKNWLASEIGIKTDGATIVSVDREFAAHKVRSFLTGLEPVKMSKGVFYKIREVSGPIQFPALVYPVPTIHPCVNRLILAADDTVGLWPTPTYALGKYQVDDNGRPLRDKPLIAYLIVNICLDLGSASKIPKKAVLTPMGQLVVAFHYPCNGNECSLADGVGHKH